MLVSMCLFFHNLLIRLHEVHSLKDICFSKVLSYANSTLRNRSSNCLRCLNSRWRSSSNFSRELSNDVDSCLSLGLRLLFFLMRMLLLINFSSLFRFTTDHLFTFNTFLFVLGTCCFLIWGTDSACRSEMSSSGSTTFIIVSWLHLFRVFFGTASTCSSLFCWASCTLSTSLLTY